MSQRLAQADTNIQSEDQEKMRAAKAKGCCGHSPEAAVDRTNMILWPIYNTDKIRIKTCDGMSEKGFDHFSTVSHK